MVKEMVKLLMEYENFTGFAVLRSSLETVTF